jgi:hypothetical protein
VQANSGCEDLGTLVSGTFASRWYPAAGSIDGAKVLHLQRAEALAHIDMQLSLGGWITGHVGGHLPVPTSLMCVMAHHTDGDPLVFGPVPVSPTGAYRIDNIDPGKYRVETHSCYGGPDVEYYFGATTSRDRAQIVTVHDGVTTRAVNIYAPRLGSVAGVVRRRATHSPVFGECVRVLDENGVQLYPYQAFTSRTGAYRIDNLPDGRYMLEFEQCGYPSNGGGTATMFSGSVGDRLHARTFTATPGQVARSDELLDVGGSISGIARDAARPGGVLTDACVGVVGVAYTPSGNQYYYDDAGEAVTSYTGAYRITGLAPGSYKVRFSDCGGGHNFAGTYFGNTATPDRGRDAVVRSGHDTPNVSAALDAPGFISGRVTYAAPYEVLPFACVDIVDAHGALVAEEYSAFGYYTIGDLARGRYRVRFSSCGNNDDVTQFYRGAHSVSSATPVGVARGRVTGGIDATLRPQRG